jgi:hypothetical protein
MTRRTPAVIARVDAALSAESPNPPAHSWAEWKTWGVVFALAMLFGFIEAAQLRLGSSVVGQGIPVRVALALVMPYWLLAACALPLIAVLARRVRLWRFFLRPNIAALAVAATAFPVLALAGRALLAAADADGGARPTSVQLFQAYFPLDLITYTAFVGTLYAFHYFRESRRREITASRLQASLVEARLGGLEARVDPTFLFNTLDDISTLANRGQQTPVIEMLGRLSEVLRAALNGERPDEIPLRHELKLLQDYVRDLDPHARPAPAISIDVPPELLEALVPRMILPTLAESTTRHADSSGHTRHIAIRATQQNDTLCAAVDVTDARESSTSEWPDDDIQLLTIRDRLERLYGRAQALEVTRDAGVARAVLSIPLRQALAGEERAST